MLVKGCCALWALIHVPGAESHLARREKETICRIKAWVSIHSHLFSKAFTCLCCGSRAFAGRTPSLWVTREATSQPWWPWRTTAMTAEGRAPTPTWMTMSPWSSCRWWTATGSCYISTSCQPRRWGLNKVHIRFCSVPNYRIGKHWYKL